MNKLKDFRESKGLSQKELANVSGISKRTIQDYEQGNRSISGCTGDRLYRLSLSLGCKVEDLLDNKEDIEEDVLKRLYAEYRRQAEEHNEWEKKHGGSIPVYWNTDCGEDCVREDFSEFANLEETISFEVMLKLEQEYDE